MKSDVIDYLIKNGFYIWEDSHVAMKKLTICEHCGKYVTLEIMPDGDYRLWDERGCNSQTSVSKEYICNKVSTIQDVEKLITYIRGVA